MDVAKSELTITTGNAERVIKKGEALPSDINTILLSRLKQAGLVGESSKGEPGKRKEKKA
jgi:hypothetical protein